jgi:hypothetical protein
MTVRHLITAHDSPARQAWSAIQGACRIEAVLVQV